jgi:predicted nucleotidyltransferase
LKAIASGCITRHHSHHYLGFAQTQWKLFNKEQPQRIKPLLYVYRVLLTGIYLMQTGKIEANLVQLNEVFKLPYIADLIERKLLCSEKAVLQNTDITFYQQEYNRLLCQLEQAYQVSCLPYFLSAKIALNELLIQLRLNFFDYN